MQKLNILLLSGCTLFTMAASAHAQQAPANVGYYGNVPRAYYAQPTAPNGYLTNNSYQQRAYGYGYPVNPTYAPAGYARAQEAPRNEPYDYLVFAGIEGSGHNGRYGNIGAIGAIGDSHFGNGPVWRAMIDSLEYAYTGGVSGNQTIEGNAIATEAALGYIHSWEGNNSVAGYLGAIYRETDLSPSDPNNELEGGKVGLKMQAETMLYGTPDWRTGGALAYVVSTNNAWWTRATTQYRPWGNFFVGPEFTAQGDDTYNVWQLGALINGIHLNESSELGFRAGYKKIENLSGTGFAGAEFSTMF